jgi:hypothetical protein
MNRRGIIFVAIVVVCVLAAGTIVFVAAINSKGTTSKAEVAVENPAPPASAVEEPRPAHDRLRPARRNAPLDLRGDLLVRAVDPRDARLNGKLTRVRLDSGDATPAPGHLACQRVYFAGGYGLCLALASSGVDYDGIVFDERGQVSHEFPLEGLPSRARVSPTGRLGSVTTFVSGDSYAEPGQFSTRTRVYDMHSGRRLADLEQFEVIRDGSKIDAPDFNFWGVTFAADDDRFYATLATAGHRYLVQGSLRRRTVEVLLDDVECPSLSPDETRIVYKRRRQNAGGWRLHVLNLRTLRDITLAERRSVDDQAEWLSNETVVYGKHLSVWAVRADGNGRPRRVLRRAASPARVRFDDVN